MDSDLTRDCSYRVLLYMNSLLSQNEGGLHFTSQTGPKHGHKASLLSPDKRCNALRYLSLTDGLNITHSCYSPCPVPFVLKKIKNSPPFDGMFQLAVGRRFGFPPLDASTPPFFCVSLSLPWTEWPKRSLFPNVWIFSWFFGFDLQWTPQPLIRSPFFRLTGPSRLKCVKA